MGRYSLNTSFIGNYLNFLFVEILSKSIPFWTLPLIVNSSSKETFGMFSLFITGLPVLGIIVIGLGQQVAIRRVWIWSSEKRLYEFTSLSFFNSTIMFFFLLFCIRVYDNFLHISVIWYVALVAGLAYAYIDLYLQLLMFQEKVKEYNIIYFIRQVTPYVFVSIFCLLKSSITPLDLSIVFSVPIAILAMYVFAKIFPFFSFQILSLKKVKYLLFYSMYALLSTGSAFVLNFADRYMIAYFYSANEVAEYSVAYTVAMILSMLVLACNKAWQPFILKSLRQNKIDKVRRYARLYVLAILVMGIILSLLSKRILLFISNASYLDVSDIIPVIIAGIFFYFLYTLYSNIAFYYKKMLLFSLPAIVAAVTNIILNFLLLPIYGYKIAAWTTLISYLFEFGIIYFIATKVLKTKLL